MQRAGKAKIESRIVDQQNGVRFARFDFVEHVAKLFSEIAVMLDHFPKTEHAGLLNPVFKLLTRGRFHLRAATSEEGKIDIDVPQSAH